MPLLPSRTSYSVAWTLLLLFIAWPLSYFSASWWIFFLPFEERYECIREVQEFLEKLVYFPFLFLLERCARFFVAIFILLSSLTYTPHLLPIHLSFL
jgi:hypothetical protein